MQAVMKPTAKNQLRLVPSVVKSATMSVDVKVEASGPFPASGLGNF